MSSKQLNFYSHPDEIKEHLKFILSKGSFISFEPFLEKNYLKYEECDTIRLEDNIFKLIIFRQNEATSNIRTKFIISQEYYLFEPLESNVIFFSFPKIIDNSQLLRGRFYFVTGYWKGDQWVKKSPEFIGWAGNLLRDFKRRYLLFKDPVSKENCTEVVKTLLDESRIELKLF